MSVPLAPWISRVLLYGATSLFVVFFGLAAYHRWQKDRPRFTPDADLLAELADATFREAPDAPPSDWPQWRGGRRDGFVSQPNLLKTWDAKGPARLWQIDGGEGYSAFVVRGDRAFTMLRAGEDEVVLCLDPATGKEKGRFAYACEYNSDQGSGPRATPSLDGDRVYSVGATGMMHCCKLEDAGDGKVALVSVWSRDLKGEYKGVGANWGVSFSPLVDDRLVYTMPGGPGACAVALDKLTGEPVWQTGDDPAGYASPVAMTTGDVRQIVFFTGTHLLGVVAEDGRQLWRYSWPTEFKVNAATPIPIHASDKWGRPLHYVFISSGYGQGCALVKLEPDGQGGVAVKTVYETNRLRNHFSSSVRVGGHIYGFDEGMLTCLDLKSGEQMWSEGGFNKGTVIAVRAGAETHLVVLGENGRLGLVEAVPDEYRVKADGWPMGRGSQRHWTAPTLADGRLFIRNEKRIACFDLREK